MADVITRRFATSIIYGSEVIFENGQLKQIKLKPIKIDGKVKEDKALKHIQKAYGKQGQYVITDIKIVWEVRQMELQFFMDNSKVVEVVEKNNNESVEV